MNPQRYVIALGCVRVLWIVSFMAVIVGYFAYPQSRVFVISAALSTASSGALIGFRHGLLVAQMSKEIKELSDTLDQERPSFIGAGSKFTDRTDLSQRFTDDRRGPDGAPDRIPQAQDLSEAP